MSVSAAVGALIALIFLAGMGYFLYQQGHLSGVMRDIDSNLPSESDFGEPQTGEFVEEGQAETSENSVTFLLDGDDVTYPLLFKSPRWVEFPIKYYMDRSTGEGIFGFDDEDLGYVRRATAEWTSKTGGMISFEEVQTEEEAALIFSWFPSLSEIEGGRVVGEGGPTRAIDTGSGFTLIEAGEVFLIPTENECVGVNRPVHEIGHVLGLGHAPPGYKDIMFSKEISCNQGITSVTTVALEKIYEKKALSDLTITQVTATKKGGFIDVSFVIKNRGLLESPKTTIGFVGDGKVIESLTPPRFSSVPKILPGSGVTSRITNARIDSGLVELVIKIDPDSHVEEFDEGNNAARIKFKA